MSDRQGSSRSVRVRNLLLALLLGSFLTFMATALYASGYRLVDPAVSFLGYTPTWANAAPVGPAAASLMLADTKTVCSVGSPDFASVAAAVANANAGVPAGGRTYLVCAGLVETAPAGGYSITATGASAANPVVFVKDGIGANPTITASAALTSGTLTDAIFKIIGADYITIDGFTMLENAANTSITPGSNNMTEWGVGLFYASQSNGAQNITIQNNTITLNRAYANTFGIYSNSTHSANAISTFAPGFGAAGGNDNLKAYGNTISNVNMGIVQIGPISSGDQNTMVDIGGSTASTGNTITDFGTTGTFSAYISVSATVNGILVSGTRNFNISRNTVSSSNGGVTSGTLNGIQIQPSGGIPTGTLTQTINNNSISLRPGAAGINVVGITMPSTSVNTTTTCSINNNDFNTFGHTVPGATGTITFISQAGNPIAQNMNGNTFTNMSVNTTGAIDFFVFDQNMISGAALSISGNQIVTGFARTSAGTTTVWKSTAGSAGGSTHTISNNNFSNFTLTGASPFNGIVDTDGSTNGPTKTINGNTIGNLSTGTGITFPMNINNSGPGTTVTNNTITGITTASTFVFAALSVGAQNQATITVSGNTIRSIASAGSTVDAINVGAIGALVSKNKIYDVSGTSNGSMVSGIVTGSAFANSNVTVSNNLIGNLTAPVSTIQNAVVGIYVAGTNAAPGTFKVYYNTVYLNNATSITFSSSSGIFAGASTTATTGTLDLRNNILVNKADPGGPAVKTYAYSRNFSSAGSLANYAGTSNNNLFYAAGPMHFIYQSGSGSTTAQTIAEYKSGVFSEGTIAPRDSASVSEDPAFLSTIGSNPNFLRINPAVMTQIESGAANIATFTDDIDGNVRQGNPGYPTQTNGGGSAPDIGADEFDGTPIDLSAPSIAYAPFTNGAADPLRNLGGIVIADFSGVNTTPGTRPRVYYKKSSDATNAFNGNTSATAGWKFVESNAATSPFDFTVDYSRLFGGAGVSVGDTIQYFVVAQDTSPFGPNVGINSGMFAATPTSVALAGAFPIGGTINSYDIRPSISGDILVGSSETFKSLTKDDADGVFKYINGSAVVGSIVVRIRSNLTIEDGAVALGAFASPYTVTIKPDTPGLTVSGAGAGITLIRTNGASRVTVDGSTTGGTDRSLTVENTSGTAAGVFRLGSIGTTPATSNTIKNCVIRNGVNTGNAVTVADATGTAGYFNNVTIRNNDVQRALTGILVDANISGSNGSGTLITENVMNTPGANSIRLNPIFVRGTNGVVISNNTIGNISNANTEESPVAIFLSTGADNASISGNTISGIVSTSGTTLGSASGILVSAGGTPASISVTNNTISSLLSAGSAPKHYGIASFSPNVTINGNTISGMTQTGNLGSWGILLSGVTNNTVSGNTVSAITVSGTNSTANGIQILGASTGVTISENSVFTIRNTNNGGGGLSGSGANGLQLSSSSLVANTTVKNNMVHDVTATGFTSGSSDNGYGINVTTGAGYNIYNNSVRMTTNQAADGLPAAFNVASSVTNSGAINLRNNILVNSQTLGTQRYSILSFAPNTVFAAIDYNDYFTTGPNLGYLSINRATLTDIVTGFGGNANSRSVDPGFISSTNLHIRNGAADPVSGVARKGITIAGITTDFDGDTRKSTPDIGADEFNTRLLSTTSTAGGSVTVPATSPVIVNPGAATTITAVPNGGFIFNGWTVTSGTATFGNAALATTTATIPASPIGDATIRANFIAQYTLTYTAGSNGSISGTSPQTVNAGSNGMPVMAVPNTGYHFVNWSDASTSNPRTDTNVTANISVTANFAINTYTLTYTAGSNGSISGTSPQTVNHGASGAAVTAVPNTGYHFVNWSDASTSNPRTDTNVTGNISVTANFAINTYTLTYTAGSNGSISGTSPQTVNHGASGAAVTAVPNTGYHFVNWSDASTSNPRTDTNVTGNISVTANFAINTYTLTYTAGANGTISGTSPQTVNHGSSGTSVTAVPNSSYHFVNWSDASTSNPRTDSNVMANVSVTANFAPNPVISGTVTYGNAIPAATRFVSGGLVSAAGSSSFSVMTGFGTGQYSLNQFGAGPYTVTPSKKGGVNNSITSFDAAKIAQHVSGLSFLTGSQLIVADVSSNGTISSFDAANIANFVVVAAPSGITGTWKFSPVSRAYASITSDISGQDYSALLMGEVSGNWADTGARTTRGSGDSGSSHRGPERTAAVLAPRLMTPADNEVVIPIGVEGVAADKGIIAYEFDLRYDPSVIAPQANPVDLAGTISRGLSAAAHVEEGLLRVAVYGPMPIDGDGVLLNLKFTAVGAPGSVSPLRFERLMLNEGEPRTASADGEVELLAAMPNQAEISGRLLTPMGQGIPNARVTLTDSAGKTRSCLSNGFGVYRFGGVQAGQTYTVGVDSRLYTFEPLTIGATSNDVTLDLVAE